MEEPKMSTDDYINVRQIGKGAFGTAHIVQHKVTGAVYVLKRVRLARQTARERTASVRELHLLSNLRHRNVLQFHGCWVEGGCNLCTLVELCEAGDLAGQIRLRQPTSTYFSEEALQDMAVQLISALAYLHRSRIAHRDLKTANILVTGEGCLKIADFGLSTVLEPDPRAGGQLLTRTVVGTPHYMSPCVLQEKPYGTPNDIWALGCVLYEVSALKPAFSAFNMAGLIRKVTSGPAPQLPGCYSESWRALVRSCLTKEPSMRPSAEELLGLEWLQPAVRRVEERFGAALPDGAPEHLEQLADLPPSLMGLFGTFAQQQREEQRRADEARERRRAAAAKWDPMARAAAAAAATAAAAAKQPKLPPLKPHQPRKPPPPPARKPPMPQRSGVPPLVPAGRPGAAAAAKGAVARRQTHTGLGDLPDGGGGRPLHLPLPHPTIAGLESGSSEAATRSTPAETSDMRITLSRASHRPSSAPPDSPARRSRRGKGERARPGGATGLGGCGAEGGEEADQGLGRRPGPSSDGEGGGSARRRQERMYDLMYTSSDSEGDEEAGGSSGRVRGGRDSRLGGGGGGWPSVQPRALQGSSGSAWGPHPEHDSAAVTTGVGTTDSATTEAPPQLAGAGSDSGGGSPQSPARQSAPIQPPSRPAGRRPPQPNRARTLNRDESGAGSVAGGGVGPRCTGAGGGAAPARPAVVKKGAAAVEASKSRPTPRPLSSSNRSESQRSTAGGTAGSRYSTVGSRSCGGAGGNSSGVAAKPRPGSATQSRPGSGVASRPGSAARSGPGPAAARSGPGSAAQSRPGSAAQSRPGSAAQSRPGSAAQSRPGSAAQSRPGSAAQQPKAAPGDGAQATGGSGPASRPQGSGAQRKSQPAGARASSR